MKKHTFQYTHFYQTSRYFIVPFVLLFLFVAQTVSLLAQGDNSIFSNFKQSQGQMMLNQQNSYPSQMPGNGNQINLPQAVLLNNNTVEFEVKALLNTEAEQYLAIFNVIQIAEKAEDVNRLINERINGFKQAVLAKGVAPENVFIDMISFIPIYEVEIEKRLFSKSYNEVPAGFELQKNIHVLYEKGDLLEELITVAAQNEIYDLAKLEYFVSNTEEIYEQLRTKAIDNLNKKITDFEKLGFEFSTMEKTMAENRSVVYPNSQYKSYKAFSRTSLGAKGKVTGKKIRKPLSIYYSKLPYEDFDIVMNPNILEPTVQFAYTLKMRYKLPSKPSQKQTKELLLVTPNGDLRPIKVD